jgi:NAD+ synthase/NAD+ synthase (glutamine-hydrolysing)
MRLGLLQLNPTVGDLDGNAARIEAAVSGAPAGIGLFITSEMALTGYPARDLLLQHAFIDRTAEVARRLAARLAGAPPVLVGLPLANSARAGRPLVNAAVVLHGGAVGQQFVKSLLPTYDVFDEDRYFEPGQGLDVMRLDGRAAAVSVCEDVWNDRDFWSRPRYHIDPIADVSRLGADVLLNLSASPFSVGKQRLREAMLGALAKQHDATVVYVNQVGGNDDLVFDGRSVVIAPDGTVRARAAAFATDVLVADLDGPAGPIAPEPATSEEEIFRALVLGTADYARKCGFREVLLGLSGGIDSALTAVVAAEAMGRDRVLGVLMPSPYSSRGSVEDSLALAANLGIRTLTLPIEPLMQAFDHTLAAPFEGRRRDVTEENIQARVRGNLLMALSNKSGALLLTTGNKSELAVGYCTLYGDMSGGLAVIADVPKTRVYEVAAWVNREREIIPAAVITKAPSAELRENQTDQDSLPPYDVLDDILERHIERYQSADEIVAAGFDEPVVRRVLDLVRTAEFKRRQAAPGLRISERAFGTGWRMPVARAKWDGAKR